MEDNLNTNSSRDTLGKLLPKAISDKRRRRKQKKARDSEAGADSVSGSLRTTSSSLLSSDGTNQESPGTSNMAEDDDRSFGSYESGPEPDSASQSRRSSLHAKSRSPSRPEVSQHPSLIGYLTTSSPVVQATHIDPQSQSQSSVRSGPSSLASSRGSAAAALQAAFEPPADQAVASTPPRDKRSRASRTSENKPVNIITPATPPPNLDERAPAIVNTPPTPTDQTPEASPSGNWSPRKVSSPAPIADGPPSSRAWSVHKRSSSASAAVGPSKLSNVFSLPLTPTTEEPIPGNNNSGSSFFSSMFSAAQNAANNFSSNIQNTGLTIGANKGRTTPSKPETNQGEVGREATAQSNNEMDQKVSTLRTIGSGDLSLSALGLDEPVSSMASPSSARFTDVGDMRARSESAPADSHANNGEYGIEEVGGRPRSPNGSTNEDVTPPLSEFDDKLTQRTSSMRSSSKVHRKRASSVTTSGTGITIGAANPMNHPSANFSTQKLTGFAIASKKRNRDFHTIFKSVPDDDYLIEDYSCALQREILAHGRLYVSEGHLCFSSNILGWQTTLVMSFDEITSVEKRSTALVFKNGLTISTLHAKHVFASFTSRDATYDLIINIWKLGHPTVTSTLNGVRLEGTGGDKTEKLDSEQPALETETQVTSESEIESEDEEEEFYDEEENDEAMDSHVADSTGGEGESDRPVSRKVSGMATSNGSSPAQGKDASAAAGVVDFPGPVTHTPTDCGDSGSHYDKVVGDEIIPAPLGKVYSLLFGQSSGTWMTKFLTDAAKCTELQFEDKKGLSLDNKSRSYNYIKPLNAPIGPKQTKCITTETLDNLDFEKAANLTVTTQTPDVPSGNIFMVKTKYCLSWAENNSTRIQVNCTIEWTGKSWLKGPIEKGANDGQLQYCKDISAALKAAVPSRGRSGTGPNGTTKGKKKGKKGKVNQTQDAGEKAATNAAAKHDWGPLESIRPVIEPITDILRPLLTGNVMYGLLVGLFVSMWFGFGFPVCKHAAPYGHQIGISGPERIAAFDELWRQEDGHLWEWLDDRVGLERLNSDAFNAHQRVASPRTTEEKLRQERMDASEVDEAVRVTEEKLRIIQEAMSRRAARRVPEQQSRA